MISTLAIKQQQLTKGYFEIGSGPKKMLIMGSCRIAPYLNYLNQYNEQNGNPFTIYSLDPFNFCWDINDDRVDQAQVIIELEADEKMLKMLASVDIFLHEHYNNFGMFNCSKTAEKNIYQFNMNAAVDVCIPSWNDVFVLFADIIAFDVDLRKKCIQDINVLSKISEQTGKELYDKSQKQLEKFYNVCRLSNIPEMENHFKQHFTAKRFWHSYNHVSKHFTLAIFRFLNDKYLNLEISKEFWDSISQEDMFANSFTPITDMDIKYYHFFWGESVIELKSKLL